MRPGRLRAARDFDALRRTPMRARRGPVRVAFVPASQGSSTAVRVAYAVGRPVGGAVVRNRVRRRLRAVVAELSLPAGDYLVSTGRDAVDLPFAELRAVVTAAFQALR